MTHPNASPKVTVILPTYNRAPLLQQAIDSIRAQTLTDWELIIIDDASTDTTPEVAQAFTQQDSRIHYHRHDTNQGVAIARNTGLKRARGSYIAFQDDDDLSHPERLQKQADYLDKHPNVALLHTDIVKLHVNEPVNWHTNYTEYTFATLMVTRAIYQKVRFRPFFVTLEDSDFKVRAEEYGLKIKKTSASIAEPLYAYRSHENAKRLGHHPLIHIYDMFWRIARAHRQHGLKDPIVNASTIGDAVHAIHPRFPRVLDQEPNLAQNIADCLLSFALHEILNKSTDAQANYHTLIKRCFPQKDLTFHNSTNGLDKNLTLLKYHLHHAIRYNQPDSYRNGLYALIRFFPKCTPYTIAHKILFACLRRGRFSFITPFLKTCLRIKP